MASPFFSQLSYDDKFRISKQFNLYYSVSFNVTIILGLVFRGTKVSRSLAMFVVCLNSAGLSGLLKFSLNRQNLDLFVHLSAPGLCLQIFRQQAKWSEVKSTQKLGQPWSGGRGKITPINKRFSLDTFKIVKFPLKRNFHVRWMTFSSD